MFLLTIYITCDRIKKPNQEKDDPQIKHPCHHFHLSLPMHPSAVANNCGICRYFRLLQVPFWGHLIVLKRHNCSAGGKETEPHPYLSCMSETYCHTISPSTEIVTTSTGISFPLFLTAVRTALSILAQQGTCILTTVTDKMLFLRMISVNFSV